LEASQTHPPPVKLPRSATRRLSPAPSRAANAGHAVGIDEWAWRREWSRVRSSMWIARPDCPPRVRVVPYSAVTHPMLQLRRSGSTRPFTLTAHCTSVLPTWSLPRRREARRQRDGAQWSGARRERRMRLLRYRHMPRGHAGC
jgi:hypothetical protein